MISFNDSYAALRYIVVAWTTRPGPIYLTLRYKVGPTEELPDGTERGVMQASLGTMGGLIKSLTEGFSGTPGERGGVCFINQIKGSLVCI